MTTRTPNQSQLIDGATLGALIVMIIGGVLLAAVFGSVGGVIVGGLLGGIAGFLVGGHYMLARAERYVARQQPAPLPKAEQSERKPVAPPPVEKPSRLVDRARNSPVVSEW